MDAGPAQFRAQKAALWLCGQLIFASVESRPCCPSCHCRDATREFCEANGHGFHVSLPALLGGQAFLHLPACHPAVTAAIQSHPLFQPLFSCIILDFSWRLVVQLSPSCTAALSSDATLLHCFLAVSQRNLPWQGQRGTVWLSAAAYDKAAFAGMCSETLRSHAGSHTVLASSCIIFS